MRNLIALVYFLLALLGCDERGTTLVVRASDDGHETIHSRVHEAAGIARFECVASASGRCHYTVFVDDCGDGACNAGPAERFSLPAGRSREVVGLPEGFAPCVSHVDADLARDCGPAAG